MNTQALHTELVDLNSMFMNISMLERRYKNTSDEESNKSAEYLITIEKDRIRKAYEAYLNNLSAQFYSAMNGGDPFNFVKRPE